MADTSTITYTGTIDLGQTLSDIIAANPQSPFIQEFFTDMALPLIDKVKKAEVKNVQLDLSKLLGIDAEHTKGFQKEFQSVTKRLLQTFKQQIEKLGKVDLAKDFNLGSILASLGKMGIGKFDIKKLFPSLTAPKEEAKPKGLVEELTHAPEMVVTDFTDKALAKLKKILKIDVPTPVDGKPAKGGDTNFFSPASMLKWLGMALGFMLGAGGLASIVSGLFDEGPLKGLKKFAGMGAIRISGKLLGKKILGSLAKKIPILGLIVGIGFGISRVMKGDLIGGLLELASGIASLEPGLGTAISIGIDAVLAARDVAEGGPKAIGKVGGMGKWDKKVVEWIKNHWPIRGFIEMGNAIKEMAAGNVPKGLKMLAHGLLSTTGFGLLADMFGEANVISTIKKAPGAIKGFLKTVWDWMSKHWPIRGIVEMADAFGEIFKGNVLKGLKMLGHGFLSTTGFGLLADMFGEENVVGAYTTVAKATGNLVKYVWDWLIDTPPMRWIGNIVGGIGKIFSGDVIAGYRQMGESIPFFNTLADVFGSPAKIPEMLEGSLKSAENLLSNIAKTIGHFIGGIAKHIWKWIRKATPAFVRSYLPRMPEALQGIGGGGAAETVTEAPAETKAPTKETKKVEQAKQLPEQVEQAKQLPEQVAKSEGPEITDFASMFSNQDVVDSIEGNAEQLSAILGVNKQVFSQFKSMGKQLGLIAQNTQNPDPSINISNGQGSAASRPNTTIRDPAYESKKDTWSRLSRTA